MAVPKYIWAIRNKLGRFFSFDGPPSPAYTKYIKHSEYEKAINAIQAELKRTGGTVSILTEILKELGIAPTYK